MRFRGIVTRSGKFWEIEIHSVPDGMFSVTQSYRWRGRRKAQSMANECAALLLDVPTKNVWVDLTWYD